MAQVRVRVGHALRDAAEVRDASLDDRVEVLVGRAGQAERRTEVVRHHLGVLAQQRFGVVAGELEHRAGRVRPGRLGDEPVDGRGNQVDQLPHELPSRLDAPS